MNSPSTYQNEKYEDDKRPVCRYGTNCYQKNPSHRRKFKHPTPDKKDTARESPAKKRKSPDNEDSNANDAPQAKKQSVSPEEDQKTDVVPNSSEEQTDTVSSSSEQPTEITVDSSKQSTEKVVDSSEQPTEKIVDSSEQQSDKMAETPKVTPRTPNKVDSSNDIVKQKDPHSESSKLIRTVFLVSMPQDFYKFYDFCNEMKPNDPTNALKIADLKLVGPYDILTGEITTETPDPDKLLTHWRYYYDPPEFQTIVKGNDKEGLHFGYWRDRPSSDPIFVATSVSNVSHKIKPVAENIFSAVANYLEERVKKANPFEKTSFFNTLGKLKVFAKKHEISLEAPTPKMKAREKNVVARTIHGAGIVCPYNKKTQVGYRELSVTDNQLLKIVKKIEDAENDEERAGPRAELGEVVRLATIAGDECDFGTCLELGHDLFSTGCTHVQNAALAVLSIAYSQLERTEFLKIFEAHMKDRKKGCNCSVLPPQKHIQLS